MNYNMGKIGNRPYKVERNSTLEKRATDGRPLRGPFCTQNLLYGCVPDFEINRRGGYYPPAGFECLYISCRLPRCSQRQYIPDRRLVPEHSGHSLHLEGLPEHRPVPAVLLHKASEKLRRICFEGPLEPT